MPFVTRLACADTPEIERERTRYIDACLNLDRFFPIMPFQFDFDDGLSALKGALAIGRQADALNFEEAAGRLDAVRASARPSKKRSGSLSTKVKGWLGLSQALESAE